MHNLSLARPKKEMGARARSDLVEALECMRELRETAPRAEAPIDGRQQARRTRPQLAEHESVF